jgi:hypothetical protein
MIPFLDNSHVVDHKFRVQFEGAHTIKITTTGKPVKYLCPPIYKFSNKDGKFYSLNASSTDYSFSKLIYVDYHLFQYFLLSKEVKMIKDIMSIRSTDEDAQCSIGTISLLYEPISGTRHILYFRKTSDQKPGFVEWPGKLFSPLTSCCNSELSSCLPISLQH